MPIDWSGYTATSVPLGGQLIPGSYYWIKMSYKVSDQANVARNLAGFMTQWNNQYTDRFEILEIKGPPDAKDSLIQIYGKARCERGGESFKSLDFPGYWSASKWDVMRSGKWVSGQGIEGTKYYEMNRLVLTEPGVPGNEPAIPTVPGSGAPATPGATEPGSPAAATAGKSMPVWGWIGIALGVAVLLFLVVKRK